MKLKKILLVMTMLLFGIQGLFAQSYGAQYTKMHVVNVELDGSVTIQVSGQGRYQKDAMDQARKNAVYNVIFKGMKMEDQNSLIVKPLIYEVNAAEKYASFFNSFFADGGDYANFVTMHDRRVGTSTKTKNKKDKQVGWTTTVRVLRPQLEAFLIERGIIKK